MGKASNQLREGKERDPGGSEHWTAWCEKTKKKNQRVKDLLRTLTAGVPVRMMKFSAHAVPAPTAAQ